MPGDRTPDPELRQVDESTFVILRSFCYRAGRADPDAGVVYLVPGEDFEPPARVGLWPTALVALPIAVIPAALILVAIVLVWLVDLGASLVACLRKTPGGGERTFEMPTLRTTGSRA